MQSLYLFLHKFEFLRHLVAFLGTALQLLEDMSYHRGYALNLLHSIVSGRRRRVIFWNRMLREKQLKLGVRANKLPNARQFEKVFGKASDCIVNTCKLSARFFQISAQLLLRGGIRS